MALVLSGQTFHGRDLEAVLVSLDFVLALQQMEESIGDLVSKEQVYTTSNTIEMKSPHTKNTLLQFAQGNRTNQKLQESIFSPTQEKLKNKKFPTLQKNKTSFHHTVQTLTDIALKVNRFEKSMCKLDTLPLRTNRRASGNSGFKKLAVQCLNERLCFILSAVLADSFVLRNRQLLKPAKR